MFGSKYCGTLRMPSAIRHSYPDEYSSEAVKRHEIYAISFFVVSVCCADFVLWIYSEIRMELTPVLLFLKV